MQTSSIDETTVAAVQSHLSDFFGTSVEDLGKLTGLEADDIQQALAVLGQRGELHPDVPHGRYRVLSEDAKQFRADVAAAEAAANAPTQNIMSVRFDILQGKTAARDQRVTLHTFLVPMLAKHGVKLIEDSVFQNTYEDKVFIVADFEHDALGLLRTTRVLNRVLDAEYKIERGLGLMTELTLWEDAI